MVLNDSTNKIHTRVRSVIGRLHSSKSAVGLASFMKPEVIPPVPLLKNFSSDIGEPLRFDHPSKPAAPVLLKRVKKVPKKCNASKKDQSDFNCVPILNQMLEQQGLLDSPISIHLTALLAESRGSNVWPNSCARRRSSSDSVFSTGLLCLPSAGPFTPELVLNPVGQATPEFSASYLNTAESPSAHSPTNHNHESDVASNNQSPKVFWIKPPNPSFPTLKLSASPAQRCLRRQGLIPHNQPISSQLLQSVISTSNVRKHEYAPKHEASFQKTVDPMSALVVDFDSSIISGGARHHLRRERKPKEDSTTFMETRPKRPLGLVYNEFDLPKSMFAI